MFEDSNSTPIRQFIHHATDGGRYSSYGVPFGLPARDGDSDGEIDSTDASIVNGWITSGNNVRAPDRSR